MVFVVALIFIKGETNFKNKSLQDGGDEGLSVSTDVLGNLLTKDSDKDGILDWEEGLWSTNPNSADSDSDGISDKEEVEELKKERGLNEEAPDPETLTQTDKFSQELFSTVAALSQTGAIDQESADRLTDSLAAQIINSSQKKVFSITDVKISEDSSRQAIIDYNENLNQIYIKYPIQGNVLTILQEITENEEDAVVKLLELDPIIEQTANIINELSKTVVPVTIAKFHLDFLNALQQLKENIENLRFFESDTIIALGAVGQYEASITYLDESMQNLVDAMNEQLKILR